MTTYDITTKQSRLATTLCEDINRAQAPTGLRARLDLAVAACMVSLSLYLDALQVLEGLSDAPDDEAQQWRQMTRARGQMEVVLLQTLRVVRSNNPIATMQADVEALTNGTANA